MAFDADRYAQYLAEARAKYATPQETTPPVPEVAATPLGLPRPRPSFVGDVRNYANAMKDQGDASIWRGVQEFSPVQPLTDWAKEQELKNTRLAEREMQRVSPEGIKAAEGMEWQGGWSGGFKDPSLKGAFMSGSGAMYNVPTLAGVAATVLTDGAAAPLLTTGITGGVMGSGAASQETEQKALAAGYSPEEAASAAHEAALTQFAPSFAANAAEGAVVLGRVLNPFKSLTKPLAGASAPVTNAAAASGKYAFAKELGRRAVEGSAVEAVTEGGEELTTSMAVNNALNQELIGPDTLDRTLTGAAVGALSAGGATVAGGGARALMQKVGNQMSVTDESQGDYDAAKLAEERAMMGDTDRVVSNEHANMIRNAADMLREASPEGYAALRDQEGSPISDEALANLDALAQSSEDAAAKSETMSSYLSRIYNMADAKSKSFIDVFAEKLAADDNTDYGRRFAYNYAMNSLDPSKLLGGEADALDTFKEEGVRALGALRDKKGKQKPLTIRQIQAMAVEFSFAKNALDSAQTPEEKASLLDTLISRSKAKDSYHIGILNALYSTGDEQVKGALSHLVSKSLVAEEAKATGVGEQTDLFGDSAATSQEEDFVTKHRNAMMSRMGIGEKPSIVPTEAPVVEPTQTEAAPVQNDLFVQPEPAPTPTPTPSVLGEPTAEELQAEWDAALAEGQTEDELLSGWGDDTTSNPPVTVVPEARVQQASKPLKKPIQQDMFGPDKNVPPRTPLTKPLAQRFGRAPKQADIFGADGQSSAADVASTLNEQIGAANDGKSAHETTEATETKVAEQPTKVAAKPSKLAVTPEEVAATPEEVAARSAAIEQALSTTFEGRAGKTEATKLLKNLGLEGSHFVDTVSDTKKKKKATYQIVPGEKVRYLKNRTQNSAATIEKGNKERLKRSVDTGVVAKAEAIDKEANKSQMAGGARTVADLTPEQIAHNEEIKRQYNERLQAEAKSVEEKTAGQIVVDQVAAVIKSEEVSQKLADQKDQLNNLLKKSSNAKKEVAKILKGGTPKTKTTTKDDSDPDADDDLAVGAKQVATLDAELAANASETEDLAVQDTITKPESKVAKAADKAASTRSRIEELEERLGLRSETSTTPTGTTKQQVEKAIRKWPFVSRLLGGRVRVVQSASEIGKSAGTKGFFKNGRVTLVADHIVDAQDARAVLLHELGAHYGFTMKEVADFAKEVRSWATAPEGSVQRKVYDAASVRLKDANVAKELQDEELVAYAVEEAANLKPSLISKVGAWMKRVANAVARLFGGNPAMTPQDLVDYAKGAAQRNAAADKSYGTEGLDSFSKKTVSDLTTAVKTLSKGEEGLGRWARLLIGKIFRSMMGQLPQRFGHDVRMRVLADKIASTSMDYHVERKVWMSAFNATMEPVSKDFVALSRANPTLYKYVMNALESEQKVAELRAIPSMKEQLDKTFMSDGKKVSGWDLLGRTRKELQAMVKKLADEGVFIFNDKEESYKVTSSEEPTYWPRRLDYSAIRKNADKLKADLVASEKVRKEMGWKMPGEKGWSAKNDAVTNARNLVDMAATRQYDDPLFNLYGRTSEQAKEKGGKLLNYGDFREGEDDMALVIARAFSAKNQRVFSDAVVEVMRPYYQKDATQVLESYLNEAAARTAVHKTFGGWISFEGDRYVKRYEDKQGIINREIDLQRLRLKQKGEERPEYWIRQQAREELASKGGLYYNPTAFGEYSIRRMQTLGAKTDDVIWLHKTFYPAQFNMLGQDMNPEVRQAQDIVGLGIKAPMLFFSAITSMVEVGNLGVRIANPSLGKDLVASTLRAAGAIFKVIMRKALTPAAQKKVHDRILTHIGIITNRTMRAAQAATDSDKILSPGLRKVTDGYFKMIGLNFWTNLVAEASYDIGRVEIDSYVNDTSKAADKELEELGLSRDKWIAYRNDALATDADPETTYKHMQKHQDAYVAIHKWVDGARLHPNPMTRTGWGNNPKYAMLWMLNDFPYTFGAITMGRAFKVMDRNPSLGAKILYPVMIGVMFGLLGMMTNLLKDLIRESGEEGVELLGGPRTRFEPESLDRGVAANAMRSATGAGSVFGSTERIIKTFLHMIYGYRGNAFLMNISPPISTALSINQVGLPETMLNQSSMFTRAQKKALTKSYHEEVSKPMEDFQKDLESYLPK